MMRTTLYKFARTLETEGKSKMHPIKLEDGFDVSHFEPNGQHKIEYDPSQEEPEREN